MIKFRCPSCDKKISVPPEFANKKVKCPRCSSPVRVPLSKPDSPEDFIPEPTGKPIEKPDDPATEKSPEEAADQPINKPKPPEPEPKPNIPKLANAIELEIPDEFLDSPASDTSEKLKSKEKIKCPHCRAPVRAGAAICITCGSQLDTVYLKAYAAAAESAQRRKSASPKAILLGGIIGTLVGVIVWFTVVYLTQFKIAIPCIVGITSSLGIFVVAREGTDELGKMAALLTGAGLLLGTLALTLFMPLPTVPQKMGKISSDQLYQLTRDNAAMYEVVCCVFAHTGELDQNTADLLIEKQIGHSPGMQLLGDVQQADEQINSFLNSRTPKEKIDLARQYHRLKIENYLQNISILGRFKEFISILDFLWYFLAVIGSWKIGSEMAKSA